MEPEKKKPKPDLATSIKKLRKRVKKLEGELKTASATNERLEEELAKQGRMLTNMGVPLRECMKKLNIQRYTDGNAK